MSSRGMTQAQIEARRRSLSAARRKQAEEGKTTNYCTGET